MRRLLPLALLAGVITLAIIIGQRISTDAMAVMVGVVFGVAASIPTSLLVALAMRGRQTEPPYHRDDYQPAPPAPQIYVVNPGQLSAAQLHGGQAAHTPPPPGYFYANEPGRRYKVVGEAEYELDQADQDDWIPTYADNGVARRPYQVIMTE